MNQPEQFANTTPPPPPASERAPTAPPQLGASDPRIKSPVIAGALSLMPGLGQVYVGYYQRGFVHILVIAGLVALMASDTLGPLLPLAGLFFAFFWLYNVIDAARRASLYNQALAGGEDIELPADFKAPTFGGSIAGGLAFVAAGAILLANTRFGMSLEWIEDWWPAALILFGGYLIYKATQDRTRTEGESSDSESFGD